MNGEGKEYHIGKSLLQIKFGDLTNANADVIVSSDDYYLSMSGGVSRAILAKSGECVKIDIEKHVPANIGDVIVTTAGNLPNKYIFHGVTIGETSLPFIETVYEIIQQSLTLLDGLHLSSIAFPVIGTGTAAFNFSEVAIIMNELLVYNLRKRKRPLQVYLYLYKGRHHGFDIWTGEQKNFNLFFDEAERLQLEVDLNPFQKSIALIDKIDDFQNMHNSSDLGQVQKFLLRSKFALLENNIAAQSNYLKDALALLDDPKFIGPATRLRHTITKEMELVSDKIDKSLSESHLIVQLQKIEYSQYLDNALKIIEEFQ